MKTVRQFAQIHGQHDLTADQIKALVEIGLSGADTRVNPEYNIRVSVCTSNTSWREKYTVSADLLPRQHENDATLADFIRSGFHQEDRLVEVKEVR